jgi:glutaredoxin-like protein NrdH
MQKPVKMYTLSTCIHCKATKTLLDKCAVPYEFIDVDLVPMEQRDALLEEIRQFNPACTFPTILIGDRIIVGFDEHEIRTALGML